MQNLRDFGNALVVALISIGLMVGALSISLVEFVPQTTPTAADIVFPSPIPLTATNTTIPTPTPTLGLESPTPSVTPTSTITFTPPAACMPPSGWRQIIIQSGETLDSIAARYRASKDQLRSANCLLIDSLVAGTVLYVPPVATNTPAVCNPGASGWIKNYTVRPGDTVYRIATDHYTTASLLKSVNCRISDYIYAGEVLWIPNVATRTPYPTPLPGSTVTPYPTDPLTETALPFTVTVIPSSTPIPPTATEIPTATAMPTPLPSPTAFPQ
ncbi:putative peptidoglycan endopeptidase LytE [Anaerolineales bacterium]|nr:putative peptidoglycan endopeptidase LytE [Anaerolineales bacterium]